MCRPPFLSFFFFCVTQRFGILWRLSWQAQPSLAWACLLYAAALSWIVRNIADKRMPLPVWLLTFSLFLSCCVLCLEQGKVSIMNFLHFVAVEFFTVLTLHECDQRVSAAEYKNIKIWPLLNFTLRDFAYVARDNLTQVLKCHVFRCDSPAKNIATSLHEMCSKVSCYRISSCCHAFFSIVYNQQNIFYTKRKCTFILYVVVCR